MIISIGYRVKSSRGISFRRWATSILKDYIMQGYVVNEKSKGALEGIKLEIISQCGKIKTVVGICS